MARKQFGENVPPETPIRDLLNIAGFGIRCLVDFLVAVEFLGSRPPEAKQLELAVQVERIAELSPEELPSKIEVEISHYPRPGHRIAPVALKDILNVPVNDRRLAHTLLCDIDESAWDSYSPELCRKLALAVVNRAKICRVIYSKEAGRIKVPMPKTNGKPIVLQLEQRTFNCLHSRGLLDNPIRLAQMTIADLVAMTSFGVKSLVDLLSSLETQASGTYIANSEVLEIAPVGRLVVKDSQAWGLGPLFRRRGGDPGDSLRILFDLKTKIAVTELGQASVDEADEVEGKLL